MKPVGYGPTIVAAAAFALALPAAALAGETGARHGGGGRARDAGKAVASGAASHAVNGAGNPAVAAAASAPSSLPTADGEIRKVDSAQRKLTVKHGRIENLNMNGMTMVFPVADPSWLEKFKAGDKVRLAVDRVNGVMTIVRLERAGS